MKSEIHKWEDATGGKSNIEGLVFPADRYWTNGRITVRGRDKHQTVDLELYINNKLVKEVTCKPDQNETQIIDFQIDGVKAVTVGGVLRNTGVFGASAYVEVEIWYEGGIQQSESAKWSDETAGMSMIENLCLEGRHSWKKCDIRIQGKKNRATQCSVTLLAGGALKEPFYDKKILNGTEEVVFSYEINRKLPLVVVGFIDNCDVIGAGADITLTGYYEEE